MWPRRQVVLIAALALVNLVPLVEARAQGFNIDLDIFSGTPAQGNGAPSSSFGAAAGQAGHWNRISAISGAPAQLAGLDGNPTGVMLSATGLSGGGIAFLNATNTGDFALLLNDAAQIGSLTTGGIVRYTFTGLQGSSYIVYTYAVAPQGLQISTPVTVEATTHQTQVVTGPMPGNAFQHLITHSEHGLVGNTITIDVGQPLLGAMWVNGFQIVPVPEPNSAIVVSFSVLYVLLRKPKRRVNQGKQVSSQ